MINYETRKFVQEFPKGAVPDSELVWVTFDEKIHYPARMNYSYQIDGNFFLNEIFGYLKYFENPEKNAEKIKMAADKMDLILKYYEIQFKKNKLGTLKIVKQKLNSLNDVLKLEDKHIFNCLGAFSNKIFPDPNLTPIKGSMLYFKNKSNIKGYYGVETDNNEKFSILPTCEYIGIGVSKSLKAMNLEEDQIILDDLYRRATSFFKPKL